MRTISTAVFLFFGLLALSCAESAKKKEDPAPPVHAPGPGVEALPPPKDCSKVTDDHPVYRAITQCQDELAGKAVAGLSKEVKEKVGAEGYCRVGEAEGIVKEALDPKVCVDPNRYVCQRTLGSANLLDSKCNLTVFDSRLAEHTPGYVQATCEATNKIYAFLAKHQQECPGNAFSEKDRGLSKECVERLSLSDLRELQGYVIQAVYTPERIKKVSELFATTKNKLLQLISDSKLVPEEQKAALKAKITTTKLLTDPNAMAHPTNAWCYRPDPVEGPPTIFANTMNGSAHMCLGAMAMSDHLNPHVLMWLMGHELGHSIDPCAFEEDEWERTKASAPAVKPEEFLARYEKRERVPSPFPGLMDCLRGGSGPAACEGSWLNCSTAAAALESCKGTKEEARCLEYRLTTPSCYLDDKDPTYNKADASDYVKQGSPRDQTREAFSDFLGAEVAGEILKDQVRDGLPMADRRDALLSLASSHALLHGVCKSGKSLDPHPFGAIRTGRTALGSKRFREGVGCKVFPPADKGGVTCEAF